MFDILLYHLAMIPECWKRVIILNACYPKWTVGFNPLAAVKGYSQERLAQFLTDIVVKICRLTTASAPRLIWLLSNSFLALGDLELSFLNLPRFLRDVNYRNGLLPQLQNHAVREYFQLEFQRNQKSIHQWTAPLLNKIGNLIFDPDLRLMFSGESTINFREVLDRKQILLVNLPKGIIGEGQSALLGAFIVAHIQKAALSRADSINHTPFFLYLDEFQKYTTDNIKDILAESRKYALSLTLAHQYLEQLSPDLRSAVLNTSGNIACFNVGYQDAQRMAREIFPSPDYLKSESGTFILDKFGSLPLLSFTEEIKPEGWDGLARQLTKLNPREFWIRRRFSPIPAKLRTLDMPDPEYTPEVLEKMAKLTDMSGERYGRLKCVVRAELEESRRNPAKFEINTEEARTQNSEATDEYRRSERHPKIREAAKAADHQESDEGTIIGL